MAWKTKVQHKGGGAAGMHIILSTYSIRINLLLSNTTLYRFKREKKLKNYLTRGGVCGSVGRG
jgi:hypothetical protein